jgi:hypothetical protein
LKGSVAEKKKRTLEKVPAICVVYVKLEDILRSENIEMLKRNLRLRGGNF